MKLTIEAGADTTILNRFGGTALIPASEHGYVENVREILEHTDVDVNHINKPAGLHCWKQSTTATVDQDIKKQYSY